MVDRQGCSADESRSINYCLDEYRFRYTLLLDISLHVGHGKVIGLHFQFCRGQVLGAVLHQVLPGTSEALRVYSSSSEEHASQNIR